MTCACGDVLDEHEDGGPCTVEGCGCVHFEAAEDEDDLGARYAERMFAPLTLTDRDEGAIAGLLGL
jgi:hypothetical protein